MHKQLCFYGLTAYIGGYIFLRLSQYVQWAAIEACLSTIAVFYPDNP
jgi:hypothetical protein